jgi:hypothetical protein
MRCVRDLQPTVFLLENVHEGSHPDHPGTGKGNKAVEIKSSNADGNQAPLQFTESALISNPVVPNN